jgi:hypothetical protein
MPVDVDVPDAGESSHNVNVGANSSGHQGPLQLYRVPVNKPDAITFSKELTVRTWGLGRQWLTTKSDADTSAPSMRMLQTSLYMFPTDDLRMYMTETEYSLLPEAFVVTKSCEVKVTPVGNVTSFETTASVSGSVTSKHYVEDMTSIGLDSEFSILPAKVTVKDDNPMEIVTTENVSGDEWVNKLYGNSNIDNYPAVLKLAFNVPWYTQIFHPGIEGSDTNMLHATLSGCFNLAPYVTTFNVENSYGIPQINYEHSFTNGLIKCSNSSHPVVLHSRVLGLGASSAPIKTFNQSFVKLDGKD